MATWVDALQSAGLLTGSAFALRELLIAGVTIWSLRADEKGRKHALALLKILRVQIRRPPPEIPPQEQLPPGPKDPPLGGSPGGGGAVA
jgi:hypothetical protein